MSTKLKAARMAKRMAASKRFRARLAEKHKQSEQLTVTQSVLTLNYNKEI